MSETLGANAVAAFTTPTAGTASSSQMRTNLDTLGTAVTAHDADGSIHFTSGANLAARPAATGSFVKWLDRATGRLYFDAAAGSWTEIQYVGNEGGTITDAELTFTESGGLPEPRVRVGAATNGSGFGIHFDYNDDIAGTTRLGRFVESGAANDTALWLWDVTAGALVRVTRGAADSGGAGYRALRVPN